MVIWTLPAKNDLWQIYNSIAYDSKIYAKRVTQNIAAKPDVLEELPLIGKAIPELNDKQIREIAVYTYRIIYEVKSVNVYILAIVHKRRDLHAEEIKSKTVK